MEMSTDRIFIVRKSWESGYDSEIIFASDDEQKAYKKLIEEVTFVTEQQDYYIVAIENDKIILNTDNDEGCEMYVELFVICADWLEKLKKF